VADQRVDKWTKWIDGTIKANVLTMHLHRDTWREVAKMLEERGDLPDSYWWEFMLDTYAITQAVAVRRQADTHKDAASLGKLIEEVRDDPTNITRDHWLSLWKPDGPFDSLYSARAWEQQWGGEVGDHLDPAIPAADFEALTEGAQTIKAYVDRHLAHSDTSAVGSAVTLQVADLHAAIDVIGGQFQRYYNLFTAADMPILVPAIQHNWKAVFQIPWIKLGSAPAPPH
jgi:hypothetical protein